MAWRGQKVTREQGNLLSVEFWANSQARPEPGQAASQSSQSVGTWLSQSENCDSSKSWPREGGGGERGLVG